MEEGVGFHVNSRTYDEDNSPEGHLDVHFDAPLQYVMRTKHGRSGHGVNVHNIAVAGLVHVVVAREQFGEL